MLRETRLVLDVERSDCFGAASAGAVGPVALLRSDRDDRASAVEAANYKGFVPGRC
jgi:hypothetical protein